MDLLTIGSEDSSPSDLPAVLTSTIAPGRTVQTGKLERQDDRTLPKPQQASITEMNRKRPFDS
ncbi:conserved hypothetical protein [Agrobacterium fabacearum CFBP 5771]|nr:hypothetical protein AGROH133_14654 [Agrobacterium tumefaciens]CVI24391.1 conserved hypothetical protein [Agrobacterium fabacearum CFBP 5771]